MDDHVVRLIWAGLSMVGGVLLACNVGRLAERFQAMSYAYRGWPSSVRTCRVIGGFLALVSAISTFGDAF